MSAIIDFKSADSVFLTLIRKRIFLSKTTGANGV